MIERLTHPEVEQKMLEVLIARDVGTTKKTKSKKKEKKHEEEENSEDEEDDDDGNDDNDDDVDDNDGDHEGSVSFMDENGVRKH